MKPQHPEVIEAVSRLREHRGQLLDLCKEMLRPGSMMYHTDLFAIGAAKRCICLVDGFCTLVENWNLVCARALLRLQIDTALRFSAVTLVEDQEAFVQAVLKDERIDRMKAKSGERLTDSYLVEAFKAKAPWLPEVYRRTSGFIHLSGQHIFSAAEGFDDEARSISWGIGSIDDHMPVVSWVEVVECFDESTVMFMNALRSWIAAKAEHAV